MDLQLLVTLLLALRSLFGSIEATQPLPEYWTLNQTKLETWHKLVMIEAVKENLSYWEVDRPFNLYFGTFSGESGTMTAGVTWQSSVFFPDCTRTIGINTLFKEENKWTRSPIVYALVTHEISHSTVQATLCSPPRILTERDNQILTMELLAGMARDGNLVAKVALIDLMGGMAYKSIAITMAEAPDPADWTAEEYEVLTGIWEDDRAFYESGYAQSIYASYYKDPLVYSYGKQEYDGPRVPGGHVLLDDLYEWMEENGLLQETLQNHP